MGMLPRFALTLSLAVVAAEVLAAQGNNAHPVHEQTTFNQTEPPLHAVPVSGDVLKALLKTREAKSGLESANDSERSNAAQLFCASEIHLTASNETDLVVMGGVGGMSCAESGWFWVVRSAHKKPQVVLFDRGNSLEVLDSSTQGYRDIRILYEVPWRTDEHFYHFDRKRYESWKWEYPPNPNYP